MSKFFVGQETVRVPFPDGEWTDIKDELTQEDQDIVVNSMAHAKAKGTTPEVEFDLGKLTLLERVIVAWSFAEDGKAIPVNRDTISRLRGRYRQAILAKADELSKASMEFAKN